jgi:hypothetical protein
MPNVFIEPLPKGDTPTTPNEYQIEFQDGRKAAGPFKTQKEAIDEAKRLGHKPLVARVRKTDKGNADHWRSAE